MARPQVQLPGVIQSTPQASPTNQFVQAKLNEPVPQHILDLSKLSSSLTDWVANAQADAHKRSEAQGEMDASLAKPFGAGTIMTPAEEANRKKWKEAQDRGEILASEDPWYRIGLFTGEGRRAALEMSDHMLDAKTIREAASVVDEKGALILNPPDIDGEFNKHLGVFMNIPAMQTVYGRNGAKDIIDNTRASFHQAVADARDKELQKFYVNDATDQLVRGLENMEQVSKFAVPLAPGESGPTPMTHEEISAGFDDIVKTILHDANVPEPRKVLRSALQGFYETGGDQDPDLAISRIDMVRNINIGKTTVEGDNSQEGLAFRARLADDERKYLNASDQKKDREYTDGRKARQTSLDAVHDGVSKIFSEVLDAGGTPEAAKRAATLKNSQSTPPEFRDEGVKVIEDIYKSYAAPEELSPRLVNEVADRLLTQSSLDVKDYIKSLKDSKEINALNFNALNAQVDKEIESRQAIPAIQDAQSALKDVFDKMSEGKSPSAKIQTSIESTDALREMNSEIRILTKNAQGKDPEKLAGDVQAILDKTKLKIAKQSEERDAAGRRFVETTSADNDKGISRQGAIWDAWNAGTIDDREKDKMIADDKEKTNRAVYLSPEVIQGVLQTSVPNLNKPESVLAGDVPTLQEQLDMKAEIRKNISTWLDSTGATFTTLEDRRREFDAYRTGELVQKTAEMAGTIQKAKPKAVVDSATTLQEGRAAQAQAEAGLSFQKLLVSKDQGVPAAAMKEVADVSLKAAKTAADTGLGGGQTILPPSLKAYRAAIGEKSRDVDLARISVRQEIGEMEKFSALGPQGIGKKLTEEEKIVVKRSFLSTGVASIEELERGSLSSVFDTYNSGSQSVAPFRATYTTHQVDVPFKPEDINPWTTQMIPSKQVMDAVEAINPGRLRALSLQYKVPPDQFEAWKATQALMIKNKGN